MNIHRAANLRPVFGRGAWVSWMIWDLDNCLADDSKRISLIDYNTSDPTRRYEAYHEACGEDELWQKNAVTFHELLAVGMRPLFITGRPNAVRQKTLRWIEKWLGVEAFNFPSEADHLNKPLHGRLLMRPDGCELSSVELKERLLSDWFVSTAGLGFRLTFAFDDHDGILKMYREKFGIPAFQLKVHDLDAYKGEAELTRGINGPAGNAASGAGSYLDTMSFAAPDADLGPVQGAQPLPKVVLPNCRSELPKMPRSAADVLRAMADTFEQRNSNYKDNSRMVPKIIRALFPAGVPSTLVTEEEWHLFELAIVKLTRFATSNMIHIDSIHDAAVYLAMIEAILQRKSQ